MANRVGCSKTGCHIRLMSRTKNACRMCELRGLLVSGPEEPKKNDAKAKS